MIDDDLGGNVTMSGRREWDRHPRGPIGQLSPQPWMKWPETQALITALQARGTGVRFVGGCVRDGLLNRPVHDVDIATPDVPETVVELLHAAGIKAVPTGLKHGTVTAVVGERRFEVTTLREDMETDGRHAVVRWSSDWMADAARRDFTINALSARPDGAVYDYFNGIEHLSQGRVVFVGRAMERIAEDYLRILRFFRFQARYGCPPVDPDAYTACQVLAGHLADLSAERVRDELFKILETPVAADIFVTMRGARVLEVVLPQAKDLGRLRQLVFLEERGIHVDGVSPDALRRLAAVLAEGAQDDALAVAEHLRLSNRQRDRLVAMTRVSAHVNADLSPEDGRKLCRREGNEVFRDALLLAWSGVRAQGERRDVTLTAAYCAHLDLAATWEPPVFPVRGADLLALGLSPGPEVGGLAVGLEQWWEDQGFRPGKDEILQEARYRLGLLSD